MTSYSVDFSPECEEQLAKLYEDIAAAASPKIAADYTGKIVAYCEGLSAFRCVALRLVRTGGLEPPWPFGLQILSLLRLPVSPRPQSAPGNRARTGPVVGDRCRFGVFFPGVR